MKTRELYNQAVTTQLHWKHGPNHHKLPVAGLRLIDERDHQVRPRAVPT